MSTCERMFEATFESKKEYSDPFNDVDVDVLFEAGGKSWRVPAFWRGGNQWTVRFAPSAPGRYTYRLESTDRENADLNGHERVTTITAYAGASLLLKRGAFRVSDNRRYFEQADGTPFYWLADTWYTGLSDRLPWEGFQRLTADRKAKGYTAITLAVMTVSNEETAPSDPGFCNEGGCVWDPRFHQVNPNYFDCADRRVQHLVNEGLAPVLIGAWHQTLAQMGFEKMKKYWRYIIARYAAYPVFWVAGGEVFDPPGSITHGWTDVVKYIRDADPYHHPLSAHEGRPPQDMSVQDETLTDFDFFQPSHGGWASIAAQIAQLNLHYARTGVRKPLIVGETGWENLAKAHLEDFQRAAFWLAMLNGAAGFSYGNAEIAECYSTDKPLHRARYSFLTWEEAMSFPGAYQAGIGAKLLQRYPWWLFEPHPEWVTPRGTTLLEPHDKVNGFDIDLTGPFPQERRCEEDLPLGVWREAGGNWRLPYAAGIAGKVRVIYIPYQGSLWNMLMPVPTVHGLERNVRYRAYYWEPSLGVKIDLGIVAAPAPGTVIHSDRFANKETAAWVEKGAKAERGNGELSATGPYLSVLKNESHQNFVVAVDARSHTDAGLILRYQDEGNYLTALYSPQEQAVYLIDRKDGIDGAPMGRTPVPVLKETFRLSAEVRNHMAAVSIMDGQRTYATPIVEVKRIDAGSSGFVHRSERATQQFAHFELSSSPELVADGKLDRKLYDAEGRYRGEWKGPATETYVEFLPGFTSMDDYGTNKHLLLGSYRPERLPFVGDFLCRGHLCTHQCICNRWPSPHCIVPIDPLSDPYAHVVAARVLSVGVARRSRPAHNGKVTPMLPKLVAVGIGLLFVVRLSISVSAQSLTEAATAERVVVPVTLLGAVQWEMTSRSTGRRYRIYVSKPTAPPPATGYPVVYVTDGNFAFSTVAAAMGARQSVELRPAVVVGIGYPDGEDWSTRRNLDLAPRENISRPGEGAEAFYRFLTEEVRPAITADYSIDSADQSLLGGSLGGLFTLYVLFNHPEAFSIYLAGSPSIWWNDRAIVQDVSRLASAPEAIRANLQVLITVGSLEQSYDAVSTPPELRERIVDSRMIDNARELASRLQTLGLKRVEFHVLESETHVSVWPSTYSRGLSFALKLGRSDRGPYLKH